MFRLSMLSFMIAVTIQGGAHAEFVSKKELDTKVTCRIHASTKNGLPYGELHGFDPFTLQFSSTKTMSQKVALGTMITTFGFGKVELNKMVRSWDIDKNEILTPLRVVIEVGLHNNADSSVGKFVKYSVSLLNPFTNQIETQESLMTQYFFGDTFLYTENVFKSPNIQKPKLGDLIYILVHCQFHE